MRCCRIGTYQMFNEIADAIIVRIGHERIRTKHNFRSVPQSIPIRVYCAWVCADGNLLSVVESVIIGISIKRIGLANNDFLMVGKAVTVSV